MKLLVSALLLVPTAAFMPRPGPTVRPPDDDPKKEKTSAAGLADFATQVAGLPTVEFDVADALRDALYYVDDMIQDTLNNIPVPFNLAKLIAEMELFPGEDVCGVLPLDEDEVTPALSFVDAVTMPVATGHVEPTGVVMAAMETPEPQGVLADAEQVAPTLKAAATLLGEPLGLPAALSFSQEGLPEEPPLEEAMERAWRGGVALEGPAMAPAVLAVSAVEGAQEPRTDDVGMAEGRIEEGDVVDSSVQEAFGGEAARERMVDEPEPRGTEEESLPVSATAAVLEPPPKDEVAHRLYAQAPAAGAEGNRPPPPRAPKTVEEILSLPRSHVERLSDESIAMLEERLAEDVKAGSSGRLLELVRALERIAENQQTFESSLVDGNWDLVYSTAPRWYFLRLPRWLGRLVYGVSADVRTNAKRVVYIYAFRLARWLPFFRRTQTASVTAVSRRRSVVELEPVRRLSFGGLFSWSLPQLGPENALQFVNTCTYVGERVKICRVSNLEEESSLAVFLRSTSEAGAHDRQPLPLLRRQKAPGTSLVRRLWERLPRFGRTKAGRVALA